VGGGLAGLYAACLLERQGIHDYLLVEARKSLGGRIAYLATPSYRSAASEVETHDRFDLGPTWFWPDLQPEFDQLIRDLGLQRFAQFETGDTLIENTPDQPPVSVRGYANSPVSMRLMGGMSSLIDALHRTLDPRRLITGFTVRKLCAMEDHVVLTGADASGQVVSLRAEHILVAIPPRLAESTIEYDPPLPNALRDQWRRQPTWMAPHAKYVAIYPTHFWRNVGLSGEARSRTGPLGEIHDASMPGGSAALFGFFAIPAQQRKHWSEAELLAECRAQLMRMFGHQAERPLAEAIKDWAADPLTATVSDEDDASHPNNRLTTEIMSGPWQGRLTGIASEWSRQFPGYLAGAIEAATSGVESLSSDGNLHVN
jgi:monoamine oxidase